MRVGIITFHKAVNYGAVLQTYALWQKVKELGVEAQVIDYVGETLLAEAEVYRAPFWKYKNPIRFFRDKRIAIQKIEKKKKLEAFSQAHIKKTVPIQKDELSVLADNFDKVITGSDQVWNEKITGKDYSYFLDFVAPSKRIAYAASIGNDRFEQEDLPSIQPLLSDYQAISVREKTAQAALQYQLGLDVAWVLDPTFLLPQEKYRSLTQGVPVPRRRYILLYMLHYSASLIHGAKGLSKKLHIPVYCINASGRIIPGVKDCSDAGIEEFLSWIANADFVLTNSFHGMAFSIIFNKDFNVELPPLSVGVGSRITDLAELLHLSDRLISDGKINLFPMDYTDCNRILSEQRDLSVAFLRNSFFTLPKKKCTIEQVTHAKCSGCGLCSFVCPMNAIEMKAQEREWLFPTIDYEKCVFCGKCFEMCTSIQSNVGKYLNEPKKVFAAYSKTPEVVFQSTSGGSFYEVAHTIISQNGTVYGAAFDEDFNLRHRRIDSMENIRPLQGSKYTQSAAYRSFSKVLEDLKIGKKVLFVGTPCQVSALKALCKGIDENLYLVDLVCHGVPSPELLKQHIRVVEQYFGKTVLEYHPRSKEIVKDTGKAFWGMSDLFVFTDNTKEFLHPVSQAYKIIFNRTLGLRESCTNCCYADMKRVGDLTLSDYWGLELLFPDLVRKEGVSMILCNTEKGAALLNNVSGLNMTETSQSTILAEKQPNLFHPTKMVPENRMFWLEYDNKGWNGVIRKYANCSGSDMFKWRLKKVKHMVCAKRYRIL